LDGFGHRFLAVCSEFSAEIGKGKNVFGLRRHEWDACAVFQWTENFTFFDANFRLFTGSPPVDDFSSILDHFGRRFGALWHHFGAILGEKGGRGKGQKKGSKKVTLDTVSRRK